MRQRQHGVIARAQLVQLGLTDSGIARRVRDGRLHRVHQGVYAVGHPKLTMEGRFLAAVVSCGSDAALSHASAAVLWHLLERKAASGGRDRSGVRAGVEGAAR